MYIYIRIYKNREKNITRTISRQNILRKYDDYDGLDFWDEFPASLIIRRVYIGETTMLLVYRSFLQKPLCLMEHPGSKLAFFDESFP